MKPGASRALEGDVHGRSDDPPAARRLRIDGLGLILLTSGIGIAWAVAKWMEIRGRLFRDTPVAAAFAGFLLCFALAFLAGRRARRPSLESRPELRPGDRVSRGRVLGAIVLSLASFALMIAILVREGREPVPLGFVAVWLRSLLLGSAAIAAVSPRGSRVVLSRAPRVSLVALCLIVAGAGWVRLYALGESPAVLGGDEANHVLDAIRLLDGTDPGANPFGTGWYSTMRLGMLPAGIGARASRDPIGGPRFPYAVAGGLSVLAAAAAGWLIGGPWAGLGAAAFLALAPHHLHFSRLSSSMILDALAAALFVFLVLAARRSGSPILAFLTGAVGGLALYGYAAGRVVPVCLAAATPFLMLSPPARGRRVLIGAAVTAGFLLAAAPNLRFAARHFDDWNGRFNQVGIFRRQWWNSEVNRLGSPIRVLQRQFVDGTAGLLFMHTDVPWYTGYPIVAPAFLPALGAAGLGFLLGLGKHFEAMLTGVVVAGNFAGVVLTDTTPSPQRLSSLFPALAILAGVAVAGFLGFVPAEGRFARLLRIGGGTLILGLALCAGLDWIPTLGDPSPRYGGDPAATVVTAFRVLSAPRFRTEEVYLEGSPDFDSTFPSVRYLLSGTRIRDRDLGRARHERPPSGLHLVTRRWMGVVPEWRTKYGFRAIPLADPRDPARDVAWLVPVP
jgi:hypothetical protein